MLELVRSGQVVTCNGIKLTMVEQKTKGPGNEVIKIEGLDGANGQKWVSLRSLQEGKNQVNTKGREVSATQVYTLNMVEQEEITKLQTRINEIKTQAKIRYDLTPKFKPVGDMNAEELEVYIEYLHGLKVKGE